MRGRDRAGCVDEYVKVVEVVSVEWNLEYPTLSPAATETRAEP